MKTNANGGADANDGSANGAKTIGSGTNAGSANPLQAIQTQVMWNRLIAVVEEQAQALLRTAFGSVAREAGDLSAGVYDMRGRMLAQAVTGTPGHVNTMAVAVGHFLERFPPATMRPGDVYVTNDPWLGTGHLFDFVVVTPVFRAGRLIALFASTCHTIDVGGIGFSADARSVFEEGVCIPHLKLVDGGRLNEDLLAIVQVNSRNPVEARGDILSLVSSNDVGAARLLEMMDEFALDSIEPLAEHILTHSAAATRAAIARLPSGSWDAAMTLDGYDAPVELRARLTIAGDRLRVDFAGTSAASNRGINSPKCYSDAYSVFGLKCLIAPDVPNNAGSLAPFEISAPADTVVSPERPRPVTARHVIGQMLPDLMFGCLEAALGGRVPGESAGSIWVLAMAGTDAYGAGFNVMSVGLGGTGARPEKDGLSTTAFPSGVGGIPVEVTESQAPLVFWHKEYLSDSGGPGRRRGGLAQRIEVAGRDGVAFNCNAATFDRRANPARGRAGGTDGAPGRVHVVDRTGIVPFTGKGAIEVPPGARLRVDLPGGGGFGPATERDPALLARDVANGLVSTEAATADYRSADHR
ncbi:MAG: hydantoinase B/oxoprolinase family protein [Lautropia sp.]